MTWWRSFGAMYSLAHPADEGRKCTSPSKYSAMCLSMRETARKRINTQHGTERSASLLHACARTYFVLEIPFPLLPSPHLSPRWRKRVTPACADRAVRKDGRKG